MKHIKKIKIDIDKKNFEVIPSVQYDSNTRYLHIQLLNDSVPFDITGCSVILSGVKEDGNSIFNSCDIINSEIGFIQAEVTEQMNAIPGYIDCEIKIYNGEGVLTSKKFTIKVTASQTSREVVSSNEFKALTDALTEVQGIDNKFGEVYEHLETNKSKISYFVTPELFGCVGDGKIDDTVNLLKMVTYANTYKKDVIFFKKYKFNKTLKFDNRYNGKIKCVEEAELIFDGEFDRKNIKNIIHLENCRHAKIENMNITTSTNLTPIETWGKLVFGIELTNCKNIKINNCEISKVVDAISVNGGKNLEIKNNVMHELGEEGIVMRQCTNYNLINNEVYNHVGDGFLLKQWIETNTTNATIEGNYFHDGLMQNDKLSYGGGITSNAEHSVASTGFHENIKIRNNKFDGVNYGIILIGATNVDIRENSIKNFSKVGIAFDSKIKDRNENNLPAINWNIENNNIEKGTGFGISVVTTRTNIDNIKIKNNKLRDLRKRAIQCMNAIVEGNILSELWGQTAIQSFGNCIIINNDIRSGSTGISNDYTATILSINGEHENETIPSDNAIVDKITIIANNKIFNCSSYGIYARNSKINNNYITSCNKGIWLNTGDVSHNTIKDLTMTSDITNNNQHAICLTGKYNCSHNDIETNVGLIFIRNGSWGVCANNLIDNTTAYAIIFEGLMTKKNYCTYNYPDKTKINYNNSDPNNPTIIVV